MTPPLRFLHPPRTGGRTIARAWALGAPEYQGHAPPTPAEFSYGITRNPWDRVVSIWHLIRDSAGPFREWVLDGLPAPHDHVAITTPCSFWLANATWVGRFERWEEDVGFISDWLNRPVPELHVGKSDRRPYPEYYDGDTRAIVAFKYADDLVRWGYRFGE